MPSDKLTIGDVEITSLSDGILELDLCNFFPEIPEDDWKGQEEHLNAAHGVTFNLACFQINCPDGARRPRKRTGIDRRQFAANWRSATAA